MQKPGKVNMKELSKVESPLLQDIVRARKFLTVKICNAEALLKMIGYKKRGQGSGQNGIAELKKQLRRYKVHSSEYIIHDGRGLSARNNISSHAMVKVPL